MTSESSHIPWVPKDMEWFIADLIQEFTFANGDGPLVWVNQILIRANSLEEAYENSLARGAVYNSSYLNSDGVQVTERFRGLRDFRRFTTSWRMGLKSFISSMTILMRHGLQP